MVTEDDLCFLKERLKYFPLTGELVYIWVPSKKALIGRKLPQGYTKRGYRDIVFGREGKRFKRHIVCYCLGNDTTIPDDKMVDHANRIKYDDRLENLRLASRSQNMMNREFFKNNKLGEKCIYVTEKGKFRVSVSASGKRYDYGRHETLEQAIEVRDQALISMHGDFSIREEKE